MTAATSTVFIAGISSDIGRELARLYRKQSRHVVGTYRTSANADEWQDDPHVNLIACDVSQPSSIERAAEHIKTPASFASAA